MGYDQSLSASLRALEFGMGKLTKIPWSSSIVIKLFTCCLLALIVFSCERAPQHIQIADRIADDFSCGIKKTYGLHLFGYGGAMMEDVKKFNFAFECTQHVDVAGAREIFVRNIENFLARVNSNPEIRPYLHDYPFTIDNLEFSIAFYDTKGNSAKPPFIAYVSIIRGSIYYCVHNPEKITKLENFYVEPYEEAVRIVNGQAADRSVNIGL